MSNASELPLPVFKPEERVCALAFGPGLAAEGLHFERAH